MNNMFTSPADIQRHLDSLGLFHMDMGLGRMRRALAALSLTRPPFVVAQVLGTNGKGSSSAFLASLAMAHGCRVGLYTSPHFVSPTERIRIGGPNHGVCAPWPAESWVESANQVMAVAPDLTYFEFLTVLALLIFAREGVELAVLEAGLGGRHDATTAVAADLLCYAPIALDHRDIIGPTLADIAADKAAAIRGPAPVCSVAQFPDAAKALDAAARAHKAPIIKASPIAAGSRLGLNGPHQRTNAGLALAAWQQLAPLLHKNAHDAQAQTHGLAQAFMPGRLQRLPGVDGLPPLLLDGAHNPHGMAALIKALRAEGLKPAGAVFSCLADKDWLPAAQMLKHYLGEAPMFVITLGNHRAAAAEDIVEACNSLPPATAQALQQGPQALAQALTLAQAVPEASEARPILMTGSLYLLSEFFTLHPQGLLQPQARQA
ncbi:folylpolyglutamate synthase/dihydrofolate synthase family protein [Desulfovibrio desulfuricans]|uniref:bifunctional folylpolyglutamate synthase/dihydrofolate synthase n=1 Tax=Desulfovibrio desulfuricans TaxID=876 RepID=UPI0035B39A63